jgi:hypothetical protein
MRDERCVPLGELFRYCYKPARDWLLLGGPVLIEVLVVLLVVLAGVGIFLWTRLAATGARVIDAPANEMEEIFFGGIMSRHLLTSGPLVRLEMHEWGVRLRGTLISRWLVPTWEARYDELAIAELVALPASRIAVCFRLRDGDDSTRDGDDSTRDGDDSTRDGDDSTMAFLSDRSSLILRVLEKHNVPVNRSVTHIRRVKELYS